MTNLPKRYRVTIEELSPTEGGGYEQYRSEKIYEQIFDKFDTGRAVRSLNMPIIEVRSYTPEMLGFRPIEDIISGLNEDLGGEYE